MADLHDLTALEQGRAVRAGEVSPTGFVRHYLDRIEQLDTGPDALGAYVTVTADLALEQAAAAERLLRDDPGAAGPLTGVPVALKDLFAVTGIRLTQGSATTDHVSVHDDHSVVRLREAGVSFLGKTTTSEFGLACWTETYVAPPARSPWDRATSAGGSSGGAAAAVAGGLAPVAQGSDGAGSIRIPASVTGLVGLKPARGRVSTGPLRDPVGDLPTVGPIAHTVADSAALLDAMAGPFPGDPTQALPLPPGERFLDHVGRDPGRLRIGRYATPITGGSLHPDVQAAYDDVTALLAGLGHDVEDVPAPFTEPLVPTFHTLWFSLAALVPVPPDAEDRLLPLTRWMREQGAARSARDLASAVSVLRLAARQAIAATVAFDAVLTPVLASPPAAVGGLRDDDDPAADLNAQTAYAGFTAQYNVTGQPALALPLHWTDAGVPIGVQLVGRPDDEAGLLRLGAQLEQARPWHARRPPGW